MQHKTQINIRHPLLSCLAIFLTVLLINSCKKADILVQETKKEVIAETPQNFFNLPANASPVLKRIAKELERQNKSKEFITAFIAKEGFPIWSKSRIERQRKNGIISDFDGDGLEDTTVYIPLVVSAENYVTGFLKATVDDSVHIKIYRQNDYVNFPFNTPTVSASVTTAENYAIRMMTMDRDVFGTTSFEVKDKRLFKNNTDYSDTADIEKKFVTFTDTKDEESFADGTTISNYQYEVCWTVDISFRLCHTFSGGGSNTQCPLYTFSVTTCTTYETGGGEGGSGGGSPGGSGSGTWPFPPSGPGGGGAPCVAFGASVTNSFVPIECNPSGNNPWPPLHPVIQSLRTILGISSVQMDWLIGHLSKAEQILTHLEDNNGDPEIAKAHITMMMEDDDYLEFDDDHSATGDDAKMWWEDEEWLETMHYEMEESFLNFYLDAVEDTHPKPVEYANACSGIPYMIQASQGDKKERVGYITPDGKFFYSPRAGTSGDAQVQIRLKNGQFYYTYKMSLGAPSQSYYGRIDDTVRQEYWIPISKVIHTHVPDLGNNGQAITTTNPGKSDDDLKIADQIQKNLSTVFLYVIEVKDNGKFLVAAFGSETPDYDILGDDLVSPNPDVCSLF